MKQMTCAQIGDNAPGTCDHMITAESAKEMGDKGAAHAAEAHPELKEKMANMTDEDRKAWWDAFEPRFNAHPEMDA